MSSVQLQAPGSFHLAAWGVSAVGSFCEPPASLALLWSKVYRAPP